MSDTIRYCSNGCTRRDGDDKHPVQLPSDSSTVVCDRCERNLKTWLTDIPNHYAMLPGFLQHGTTEKNPDSKSTKRAEVAAPMRLEVIDLLDQRLGRKWSGMTPTEDRRGVIGTLQAHAQRIQDERNLTLPLPTTVVGYCNFLIRHLPWLVEQQWVISVIAEIKATNKAVAEAAGIYRRPPVGHCHVAVDESGKPCGGPLYASDYGGVHCARCSSEWDAAHLRQLGLAQAAAQESA